MLEDRGIILRNLSIRAVEDTGATYPQGKVRTRGGQLEISIPYERVDVPPPLSAPFDIYVYILTRGEDQALVFDPIKLTIPQGVAPAGSEASNTVTLTPVQLQEQGRILTARLWANVDGGNGNLAAGDKPPEPSPFGAQNYYYLFYGDKIVLVPGKIAGLAAVGHPSVPHFEEIELRVSIEQAAVSPGIQVWLGESDMRFYGGPSVVKIRPGRTFEVFHARMSCYQGDTHRPVCPARVVAVLGTGGGRTEDSVTIMVRKEPR